MKDIELLTDLVNLLDKYDAETCARLAYRLSQPDFLESLTLLLSILGKQRLPPDVQRARESQDKAYVRSQTRSQRREYEASLRRIVPAEDVEDDVQFTQHFQALKGYQARGSKSHSDEPLRDDEQIIK